MSRVVDLLRAYLPLRHGPDAERDAARTALRDELERIAWEARPGERAVPHEGCDVYPSQPDGRRYELEALGHRVVGNAPWSHTGQRWLTVDGGVW